MFRKVAGILTLLVFFVGICWASDMSGRVQAKCGMCHPAKRICSDQGKLDQKSWETTIAKMVSLGLVLKADQQKEMAAWLAKADKSSLIKVCK